MKILLPLLMLVVAGCTATYEQAQLSNVEEKLDSSRGVYISTPDDGSYGDQYYSGSGRMTVNAVRNAFLKHTRQVSVADKCNEGDCLNSVDKSVYGYFIEPVILQWEDRATAWSGKKDRLEVQLTVTDIASENELTSVVLSGKSKWATLGGDHPQDLLEKPIAEYVDSLYE